MAAWLYVLVLSCDSHLSPSVNPPSESFPRCASAVAVAVQALQNAKLKICEQALVFNLRLLHLRCATATALGLIAVLHLPHFDNKMGRCSNVCCTLRWLVFDDPSSLRLRYPRELKLSLDLRVLFWAQKLAHLQIPVGRCCKKIAFLLKRCERLSLDLQVLF